MTTNNTLRHTPVYQSLSRPNLLLGAERELVLFAAMMTVVLIVACANWVATVLGILLWVGFIPLLQRMAKIDPMLSTIFIRYLRKQSYYPARSTPFCQK